MSQQKIYPGRTVDRTYTGKQGIRKQKENKVNTVKINSPAPEFQITSSHKFRVGPLPQPLLRAQQFSAFGPSRSTKAILARNNFLNGQPQSPTIKPPEDFTQFMRGLSSNNVKPRSPEIKIPKINKRSHFCKCKLLKDMIKQDEEHGSISINDCSPRIPQGNFSGSKPSSPTIKVYLTSKKVIYKEHKQDIDVKKEIYSAALQKMLKEGDEGELMDFDHRYLRSVRQRKLRSIVYFLIKKSKEQQISLHDLIENKMTQYKPFQQSGSYSFLYYVKKGFLEKVETLLQQNNLFAFDFDEKQMTGLHIASQKNNLEMIRLLLSYNSNPMSKDMSGMTPLGYAIKHHNLDGVKLMLNIKGPSDLKYPEYCKLTSDTYILQLLRENKIQDLISRCTTNKTLVQYLISLK